MSKAGAAEERKGPVNVKRTRSLLVLGLVAVLALSAGACGGDDDDGSSGSGSGGEAAAPPPSTAFNDLTAALEGQGLVVAPLPKGSLDGAEAGVKISGEKDGTGRSFASATKAREYADGVEAGGKKTTIVGTVSLPPRLKRMPTSSQTPTRVDTRSFPNH